MQDKFQMGATSWAYKLFAPTDLTAFRAVLEQVKRLPFHQPAQVIEIFASMGGPDHEQALEAAEGYKQAARGSNMMIIGCGFNPEYLDQEGTVPSPHLTSPEKSVRDAAIQRIRNGIDHEAFLAEPGQGILSGPSFMRHMQLQPLYEGEQDLLVDILKQEIAPYAAQKGVRVALEAVCQHEGYLLMPGNDALSVVRKVDSEWIGLNFDTVHWALHGEGNLLNGLRDAIKSGYVFDVHLSEPHRKQWGTGDIGWRTFEIFQILREQGYAGPVVLENFCEPLYEALHIWRPNKTPPAEVVRNGAVYIADTVNRAG